MTTYSEEIFELAQRVATRERTLEVIRKFEQEGGQFRMSIAVDHGDHNTKATVEAFAKDHFPAEIIMKGLLKWAQDDLKTAMVELQTITDSLTAQVTA